MDYLQYHHFLQRFYKHKFDVLNLVINGLPSIFIANVAKERIGSVLNLVINGLPSIFTNPPPTSSFPTSFKPCYKWITFNIYAEGFCRTYYVKVLNLVINGLPSISLLREQVELNHKQGFKPCYKWITFNIKLPYEDYWVYMMYSFKPCYKWITFNISVAGGIYPELTRVCFKPCYKWITFNIKSLCFSTLQMWYRVLNLVINGLPSIFS